MSMIAAAAIIIGLGLSTEKMMASADEGVSRKKPLSEITEINEGLFHVGVALEISERCSHIDARKFKGLSYLWELRQQAYELGYTNSEINKFINDDAEKAKLRERGLLYAQSIGFDAKTEQGLCAFGKHEIATGSRIGSFLR